MKPPGVLFVYIKGELVPARATRWGYMLDDGTILDWLVW